MSFRMRKRSLRVIDVCCGGAGMAVIRRGRHAWCQPGNRRAGGTHRLPDAVDVKLQRNSFRYFLLHRFHHGGDGGAGWGVQGPSGGGPGGASEPAGEFRCQTPEVPVPVPVLTPAESWLWDCRWRSSGYRCCQATSSTCRQSVPHKHLRMGERRAPSSRSRGHSLSGLDRRSRGVRLLHLRLNLQRGRKGFL